MKLRYILRGAAELAEVLAYIEERSPQGAHHVQARIQAIINLLLRYLDAGQLTSKGRLRRVVASPYPYLIFFAATEDEAVIHGLRHGARRPSTMPWPPQTLCTLKLCALTKRRRSLPLRRQIKDPGGRV